MPARSLLPVVVAVTLCGCSSIDGLYQPACMAYEGDKIELADGKFTWDRFTDVRQLDEDGEPVDPFPDYPKTGDYRYHDGQLDLLTGNGELISNFYLQDGSQGTYLLTNDENKQFKEDSNVPACALRREH